MPQPTERYAAVWKLCTISALQNAPFAVPLLPQMSAVSCIAVRRNA